LEAHRLRLLRRGDQERDRDLACASIDQQSRKGASLVAHREVSA
jgi:hypothetical protein